MVRRDLCADLSRTAHSYRYTRSSNPLASTGACLFEGVGGINISSPRLRQLILIAHCTKLISHLPINITYRHISLWRAGGRRRYCYYFLRNKIKDVRNHENLTKFEFYRHQMLKSLVSVALLVGCCAPVHLLLYEPVPGNWYQVSCLPEISFRLPESPKKKLTPHRTLYEYIYFLFPPLMIFFFNCDLLTLGAYQVQYMIYFEVYTIIYSVVYTLVFFFL